MNRLPSYSYRLLLPMFLLVAGCTNPRWMVKDTNTVDPNDYEVISSNEFLIVDQEPTPEEPMLDLQIMTKQIYEYTEKVLMARYVQDYKIRPLFFSLGVLGAATAFYIANSNAVENVDGRLKTITLNAVGGLLAISTIFNYRPDGPPRPTGEERFLRASGTQVYSDTTRVTSSVQDSVSLSIYYGNQTVSQNQYTGIRNGQMSINLGTALSELEITAENPDSVTVEANYSDSLYTYSYPLSSILRPFARIETPVTELRNAPADSSDNVLTELVEGSQLQIVEETSPEWYKVLYGISENYVARNDVSLVWRTSDFVKQNKVVTVPTVPFGKIDVESNIPVLNTSNPDGMGLIVGNEDYQGNFPTRKYTNRDLHLIETYLNRALGYPDNRIHTLNDIDTRQPVDSVLAAMAQTATDSTDLVVYVSGHGVFQEEGGAYSPYLLLQSGAGEYRTIPLVELYKRIADLPAQSTLILNNLDFSQSVQSLQNERDVNIQRLGQPLTNGSITLTSKNDHLAIISASEINQTSHIYLGGQEDKKHHIFPYFFARAIQQRNTTIASLFQYLQRNVSYTARRLHDQPQDPRIFGNQSADLVGE